VGAHVIPGYQPDSEEKGILTGIPHTEHSHACHFIPRAAERQAAKWNLHKIFTQCAGNLLHCTVAPACRSSLAFPPTGRVSGRDAHTLPGRVVVRCGCLVLVGGFNHVAFPIAGLQLHTEGGRTLAIFKITHLFGSCANGWSETWYTDADSRTTARLRGSNMAAARRNMLSVNNRIEAMRVTEITLNRSCGLVPFPPYTGAQLEFSDVTWNGWLIEVMASGGYCRSFIARGVPDSWIIRNGSDACVFTRPTALTDGFNSWKTEFLINAPYMRVILDPPEGPAPIDVGGPPTLGAGGNTEIPIAALVGAMGKTVKFTDWAGPDKRALNGVFRILANTGTSVRINLPFSSLLIPGDNVGGKGWAQVIGYKAIEDVRLVRPSSRATGRAFFVRRGRRSARR